MVGLTGLIGWTNDLNVVNPFLVQKDSFIKP